METVQQLRDICQPRHKKDGVFHFSLPRLFSIYLTRSLLEKNIPCKLITAALSATMLIACLFLLSGSLPLILIAGLLSAGWSVLYCSAEEIRLYKKSGLTSIYAETIFQYSMQLLAPLCLSVGILNLTGSNLWVVIGIGTALAEILLLVMHHAQESALLRKINHQRNDYALRNTAETGGKKEPESPSLTHKIITAVSQNVQYPAVGSWFFIFSLLAFFSGTAGALKIFLLLTGSLSGAVAFYTIARKIKNSDPDKQFSQLFTSKNTGA